MQKIKEKRANKREGESGREKALDNTAGEIWTGVKGEMEHFTNCVNFPEFQ